MRRNEDYLACCEAGGKGKLAALYADFGDVREDDFHKWWTHDSRGVVLFAEEPLAVKFGELESAAEWRKGWYAEETMVVVVPLRVSKRRLKGLFARLLDARHTGKQGRPAMDLLDSTARYALSQNYTIRHLQTTMDIYEKWLKNKAVPKKEQLALWEIGREENLNKKAIKDALSDFAHDRLVGRNILAATVSRYVRQAKAIIANTAKGRFPVH